MNFVYIGLGLAVFLGLYFWSYSLNQKTEKPEGAEDLECKGCHASSCKDRKVEVDKRLE